MSNPLKAVGKAFRKVVRVVKKVALPALAIGAVVLTGGAALGALPSVGTVLGSIGIKGTLATILTSAATSAAVGAAGAALTGGNIIKGATQGFLLGGAVGGISALAAPAATAAGGAASGAQAAGTAGTAATGGAGLGTAAAGKAAALVPGEAAVKAAWGVGETAASTAASAAAPAAAAAAPAASVAAPAMSAAAPAATTAAVSSGGGMLGGLGRAFGSLDPMVQGQLISGIGRGISANEDFKDRQREREAIESNYADTSGYFRAPAGGQPQGLGLQTGAQRYSPTIYGQSRLTYDPSTGRVVAVGG